MDIDASTLEEIEGNRKSFGNFFSEYAMSVMEEAQLHPRIARARLLDVHGAWCHDMKRVAEHEPLYGA